MKKQDIGSSVNDWLRAEGTYEQTTAIAIKRVLARQSARQTRKTTASLGKPSAPTTHASPSQPKHQE